jgi:ribosomal protein S18 acetylase RimI-like enzyme
LTLAGNRSVIELAEHPARIVEAIIVWAKVHEDIRGVALVGSHARGTARLGSDIDLVVLAVSPETFRADGSWIAAIDWPAAGVKVANWADEDYGAVWSRRVWLSSGTEIEISFAPVAWASIAPLDAGTRRVISDGCRILHDPAGSLGRLYEAVQRPLNPRTADAPVAVLQPVPVHDARGAICREVLESLPEWFGIPASIDAYVSAADGLPMLACFEPAGDVVGFVSVKTHTPTAAEVYVMGVKRAWHRRGIGRALIGAAAQFAHCRGARFLTVKTLSPSNPDPNYAATRLFYEALGFLPIEEFPTLWNADNPCLLMLRPLMSRT